MRILIKGGVWKNTEDEILKAAVMKYGKNQWARISSLLVRKSPKQCKARWYEWLDPSIKKTEWSKDEDEKLLHLAKLMPTQWRTIAPIVGRTPTQCLERYQRLLDEAEAKEDGEGPRTGDEVRRLRPGEIDPDPETKPARPDPVDMDEDEKEMLSEARARLANTQGKKAKRKAREKQLEEARRLASLQKRRELKAAGIDMRLRTRKRGQMDYNADVPYHTKAPDGFWDISDEVERENREKKGMTRVSLQKLEGKRRAETEADDRKKDAKKQKIQKESGDYVPPSAVKAAQEAINRRSAREPMRLPEPQVDEAELEQIVKIGVMGEIAREIVDTSEDAPSRMLLGEYSTRPETPLRTPRVGELGGKVDILKAEARNQLLMNSAQTPLLGERIEFSEEGTGYDGLTPRRSVSATPNPLAAQLTPRSGVPMTPGRDSVSGASTPRGPQRAGSRTPMRDQMGINSVRGGGDFDETPRSVAGSDFARQKLIRQQLSDMFSQLPKPKNDFVVQVVDPDTAMDEDSTGPTSSSALEADSADIEASKRRARQQAQTAELARRSRAVQKDLPRPMKIHPELFEEGEDEVDSLIRKEMLSLLTRDAEKYPAPGQLRPPTATVQFDSFSDAELAHAQNLVDTELASVPRLSQEALDLLDAERQQILSTHTYSNDQQWVPTSSLDPQALIKTYSTELDSIRTRMRLEATRAAKLEKNLAVKLGGYQSVCGRHSKKLLEMYEAAVEKQVELMSFEHLRGLEVVGMAERLERVRREVQTMEGREREVQSEYRALAEEKEELLERLNEVRQRRAEKGKEKVGEL
ncbi:pre-mRNA splicing factor component-domain-containing protein [Cladochytrium replicatum]|nr:pre-mRNA splicing factor component-domain-containing protein [Cladochytrium replicatum]